MTILETLIESDEIVVLGPPTRVDVSVDVGERGERGSRFFIGYGDPNFPDVIPSGEQVILGDVFVNASTASRYGWLYLYLRTPSGNAWIPALRLQPSIYTANSLVVFTDGIGTISVPLENILSENVILDIDKYTIQLTSTKETPVALSVVNKEILGSNLVINITGVEYISGTWSTLAGTVPLAFTVAVV